MMQVKIKLGKDWWLLPADREFTKKELDLLSDVPYVAELKQGEQVRFFNIRKKKEVRQIICLIGVQYRQGKRPALKDGSIVFVNITGKDAERKKAQTIMDSIRPVQGEIRTVEKCGDCGHLFGRRFIPFGIGRGATFDPCLCQITGPRPSKTILESNP